MASFVLDTPTTGSSSDIFSSNRTLPQIRTIHRALHAAVDDKSARLRTQVGASYRDLLGTADSIVQMQSDVDTVQTLLGGMGGRCGRTIISKKVLNLSNLVSSDDTNKDQQETPVIAQAQLLGRCGLVAGRVLRRRCIPTVEVSSGDRLLLASKVFVLGRLLITSFTDQQSLPPEVGAIVENAEHNMAVLRRQLLRSISKVLRRCVEDESRIDVVKALCAYSLATSSGTQDVLRYFLRVRGDAISTVFDSDGRSTGRSGDDVQMSIRLYTGTLLDVQHLVPHRLANALFSLKKSPLVTDHALLSLEGLRLDVCRRWCGDEIQYYAPFIRHDDLDGSHAQTMLTNWADKGKEVIAHGLDIALQRVTHFQTLVDLRTSVLRLWVRHGSKARGFDPSEMLDSLRNSFRDRMLQVLENKVSKLNLVASEVSATLEALQNGAGNQQMNLWANSNSDPSILESPDRFLQELVSRLHSRNDAVSKAVNCFHSWKHVIDGVGLQLERLENQRWDNDMDEIEDEETINTRQRLLSRDDPQTLKVRLQTAVEQGIEDLDDAVRKSWDAQAGASNLQRGNMALFIIRVLRDIRAAMLGPAPAAVKRFGLSMVPCLHGILAETVTAGPVDTFTSMLPAQKTVIGLALWEGDPALPVQPLPHTFRFLRNVSQAMAEAGTDLWSTTAVNTAKKQICNKTYDAWLGAVDLLLTDSSMDDENESQLKEEPNEQVGLKDGKGSKSQSTPCTSAVDEDEQARQGLLVQWLFDIAFLRLCLDYTVEEPSKFLALETRVLQLAGLEGSDRHTRIVKSVQAYWGKTSMLFGILAAS